MIPQRMPGTLPVVTALTTGATYICTCKPKPDTSNTSVSVNQFSMLYNNGTGI